MFSKEDKRCEYLLKAELRRTSSTFEATAGISHPTRDATQACLYQQFSR